MENNCYINFAFISYSHRDMAVAKWLLSNLDDKALASAQAVISGNGGNIYSNADSMTPPHSPVSPDSVPTVTHH